MKKVLFIAVLLFVSLFAFAASPSDSTVVYNGVVISYKTQVETPVGVYKITKGENSISIGATKYLLVDMNGLKMCHVEGDDSLLMVYRERNGVIEIDMPYNTWRFFR